MNFLHKKKILKVAVAVLLLCGVMPTHVSAATSVKEGAKCSKVGSKVKVSKTVSFVCTKYGTKTKVLKWKRIVTKTTKPKVTVTTTVPSSSSNSKIVIKGYSFVVASSIKKGDDLTISNLDSITHTVTFGTNPVDTSADISVGAYSVKHSKVVETTESLLFDVSVPGNSTAKLPPLDVGTYSFYCTIHTSMRGILKIG
ncbi:MAG: Cupredoxin-like domain [Actinomycetota bacterium]